MEYPITEQEVMEVLEDAMKPYEQLIGGQHHFILSVLMKNVNRDFHPEDYNP